MVIYFQKKFKIIFVANMRGAYSSIDRRVKHTVADLMKRTPVGTDEVAMSRGGGAQPMYN